MRCTVLAAAALFSLMAFPAFAQTYDHVEIAANPDGPSIPLTGFSDMPRPAARVRSDVSVQALHREQETRAWQERRSGGNNWATSLINPPPYTPKFSPQAAKRTIRKITEDAAADRRELTPAEAALVAQLRKALEESEGSRRP